MNWKFFLKGEEGGYYKKGQHNEGLIYKVFIIDLLELDVFHIEVIDFKVILL